MSMLSIVPIVEGHGEVEAVPILLRRILWDLQVYDIEPARPYRQPRDLVVKPAELEKHLRQAVRDRENVSAILILLDADKSPICEFAPRLLEIAASNTVLPVRIFFACKEYKAWFLGSQASLRGQCGICVGAENTLNPELRRGAKEQLEESMRGNRGYVEVDDQPTLTARMDLNMARQNCRSFDKLCRDVAWLVEQIRVRAT